MIPNSNTLNKGASHFPHKILIYPSPMGTVPSISIKPNKTLTKL